MPQEVGVTDGKSAREVLPDLEEKGTSSVHFLVRPPASASVKQSGLSNPPLRQAPAP
jgi:hypothetical protein